MDFSYRIAFVIWQVLGIKNGVALFTKTNMNEIIKSSINTKENDDIKKAIAKKKEELFALLEKVEKLKLDLSFIKQEYNIRIGKLYLYLDELDFEILKIKKIQDLLLLGIPLDEAQKIVEEELSKQKQRIKDSYEELNEEEADFERKKAISETDLQELKQLWKELSRKYHPDVQGGDEEIMKKINKAYQDGDLETLRNIKATAPITEGTDESLESLNKRLHQLETAISKARVDYKDLLNSEWNTIKINIDTAKTENRDLLSELAAKIQEDIEKKKIKLQELKGIYEW